MQNLVVRLLNFFQHEANGFLFPELKQPMRFNPTGTCQLERSGNSVFGKPKRKISSQKLNEHKIKSQPSFFVSCSVFVSEILLHFGQEMNFLGTKNR